MTGNNNVREIESWLEVILKKENIENLSVKISGNSEKGDGYIGDIVFVEASGVTKNGEKKDYSLVLKCAKRSQVLREKSPVKEAFMNEIYFYDKIFPSFLQFQSERNVDEPFNKVPKCYGTLIKDDLEIIVLENLKKKGYFLWDRKKPLTRKHIDMIVEEYAKFHAVSIAMKEQQPEEFKQLTEGLQDVIAKFTESTGMISAFEATFEELYNLLKNELSEETMLKWKKLKNEIRPLFTKLIKDLKTMNVITHGDCWNNNFMHYHVDGQPSTFVMLDWQLARYSSPILDLSYFLFACLSKEDINDLHVIIKQYHTTLINHLTKLGIDNSSNIYPLDQFLNEWKQYCRFGVIMVTIILKFSQSEKDDFPDMVQAAESGQDISDAFTRPINNVTDYKNRMHYIVKYIADHNLI